MTQTQTQTQTQSVQDLFLWPGHVSYAIVGSALPSRISGLGETYQDQEG